jgi:hypothetical protein
MLMKVSERMRQPLKGAKVIVFVAGSCFEHMKEPLKV